MRSVAVALYLALVGSTAFADDAKPAEPADAKPAEVPAPASAPRTKVPLRIVKVLTETHQVLLFDKIRGTHVLADVGKTVEGYTVDDVDDDEVTLTGANGTQIVLVVPIVVFTPSPVKPATTSQPPRQTREADAAAPVDPYAEPVKEPVDPYAEPAPAPAPVAAPAPPPPPAKEAAKDPTEFTIARADLDAALADFATLSGSARGTFTATGLHVDSVLASSLFARAGIRANDTIASVDNVPLRSLDDAATLYARAATARNVTLHVVRGGKPVALHVTIR